jgi:hypothetical protein
MEFKVVEKSLLARIARVVMKTNAVAITFGKYIHLSGVDRTAFLSNQRWVEHELEHVRQYKKFGFFKFIFLYLKESYRKGYYRNIFEIEARAAERNADRKHEIQ